MANFRISITEISFGIKKYDTLKLMSFHKYTQDWQEKPFEIRVEIDDVMQCMQKPFRII